MLVPSDSGPWKFFINDHLAAFLQFDRNYHITEVVLCPAPRGHQNFQDQKVLIAVFHQVTNMPTTGGTKQEAIALFRIDPTPFLGTLQKVAFEAELKKLGVNVLSDTRDAAAMLLHEVIQHPDVKRYNVQIGLLKSVNAMGDQEVGFRVHGRQKFSAWKALFGSSAADAPILANHPEANGRHTFMVNSAAGLDVVTNNDVFHRLKPPFSGRPPFVGMHGSAWKVHGSAGFAEGDTILMELTHSAYTKNGPDEIAKLLLALLRHNNMFVAWR